MIMTYSLSNNLFSVTNILFWRDAGKEAFISGIRYFPKTMGKGGRGR